MRLFAVVFIGALTAIGQQPAPPKLPPAPAKVEAPKPPTPEEVKALKDALSLYQLDSLAVNTAKQTVSQTDPVAKRAMEILNGALDASPDVQKAVKQQEADRVILLEKIHKQCGPAGDWDFNRGACVEAPKPPVPAK